MERRKFITKASLSAVVGLLGMDIVFGELIPNKYTLLAFQDTKELHFKRIEIKI